MMTSAAPLITDISQLDLSQSYTYADYLSWKFSEYVELIKGRVLRKMAGPALAHQQCSSNLHRDIASFLRHKPCRVFAAPFDVRLLRNSANGDNQITTVVQPDLCVVCDPARLDQRGCLGAPDWVIEIISPSTALVDTKTKFDLYAESGVAEYWIVFSRDQAILTFVLQNGDYQPAGTYEAPGLVPSHTLPELQLQWAEVFEHVA